MKKVRVAINGFGRIGRNILRVLCSCSQWDIEVVAVNDLTDPNTLCHLLKYDSVHGKFSGEVSVDGGNLVVNGDTIKVLQERNPESLPWKELNVDIALECTGLFRKREQASMHISAGAKRVIISAPSEDADLTVVMGVNSDKLNPEKHTVISCGSCTTNCLAPVAKVILENFGIERALMTTVHSYTNDQRLLDLPHKDLRRARAAALSMIPTSTGAAKALGKVIPELNGKAHGIAIRVPTCDVSICDFVAETSTEVDKNTVNQALTRAAESSLKGILSVSEEPLVSTDYIGNLSSSTVDLPLTTVIEKKLVKVIAWYDNEMGFSARMLDLTQLMSKGIN
ncbi:MAG: type I glyceraldehyde-3-phosphate dehydrogenase [Candidatus Dadabacteria bacterium]|nr:MAG: type I glyceraldehyde-3-phosphate dehydrogenase [Candidatus Dadabacteria bacterium]